MGSSQSRNTASNTEDSVDIASSSTPIKNVFDDIDPRSPSLKRTPVAPVPNIHSPRLGKGKQTRGLLRSNVDPRSPGLKRTPFKGTTPSKLVNEALIDPRSPSSRRTPLHKPPTPKRFESPYPTRRGEVGTPYAPNNDVEAVEQATDNIEAPTIIADPIAQAIVTLDPTPIVESFTNYKSSPDGASETKKAVSRKRKPTISRDASTAMSPLKKSFSSSDAENAYPVTPTHKKLSTPVTRSPLSTLTHKNSLSALSTPQG